MSDGKVVIETDLDNTGVESGLDKLKGTFAKGMAALGIGKLFGEAVKSGSDFESMMSEVQAISGATGKELEALKAKAKEMGATTKFSATESAEALKYMAMAGWDTKQMVSGLPGVMNLAAASGENLGTVSDIVTDALTAFGLQAKDSAHFADVLAQASSNSNTNVSMMGETFKYVAPIAGSMKYSIEDTATAIGMLANAGIKGSEAGTALRSILTRLVKPPKDAAEAMEALGISAKNADGSMKPLREVIWDIRDKFSGLTDSEKAQYAASLAGQEAMSGLLAIVNTSDEDFEKLTKAIDNSNGAAKRQAKTMNNNLKGAIQNLGSAAEAVGISFYEGIKEPLTGAVNSGTKALQKLNSSVKDGGIAKGITVISSASGVLADNLDKIATVGAAAGGAFAGFKAFTTATTAVNGLTTAYKALDAMEKANAITLVAQQGGLTALQTAVGLFTGKITIATAATGAFNAACTALGGPIGLAAVAIGAVTAGLVAYAVTHSDAKTKTDETTRAVKEATSTYKEYSKEVKESRQAREDNTESAEVEASTLQYLGDRLEELRKKQHKTAAEKAEMSSIVDQLNEKIPDLALHYDQEKDSLDKTTASIKKSIEQRQALLEVEATQENLKSVYKDLSEAKMKQAQAEKTLGSAEEKRNKAQKAFNDATAELEKTGKTPKNYQELQKNLSSANKEYNEAKKAVDGYSDSIKKSESEIKGYTEQIGNATKNLDIDESLKSLAKEAGISAKDIPKSISNGIKDGAYQLPQSVSELNSLMNFQSMKDEAKKAGIDVPKYISDGLKNGTMTATEATKQLESAIKFDNLLTKAKESGSYIPKGLAEGVNTGKISVDTAITILKNGMSFQGLYEKAYGEGTKVPQGLAKAISEGKYAVPTSVSELKALVKFDDLSKKSLNGGLKVPTNVAKGIKSGKTKPSQAVKTMQDVISFSSMIKKSGLAGTDSVNSLVSKVNAGKMRPKKAMEELAKLATNAADAKGKTGSSKAGKNASAKYASSISSGKGKAKTAGTGLATSAYSGANSKTGSFSSIGSNIAKGIASGISGAVGFVTSAVSAIISAAKRRAESDAGIHSPSTLFRDDIGYQLPAGTAVGIRQGIPLVEKAIKEMGAAGIKAATDDLEIHSPSKKYRRIVGVNIPNGVAAGILDAQKNAIAATKSMIASLEKSAKNPKGKFESLGSDFVDKYTTALNNQKEKSVKAIKNLVDTQVKALKKQNKKKSAEYTKAGNAIVSAYTKAVTAETKKLISKAEKEIEELSKKYQEKYDEIVSMRTSLKEKQQSYGNIYDLDQNIADLEQYQKNLKALENKIPDSMMEKILGMDISDATQYMEWFRSLSEKQQKDYIEKWKKQQSMSSTFSTNFFSDDIKELNRQYAKDIAKATASLEKQMKQVAKDIAKDMGSRIKTETKNLSATARSVARDIVDAVNGKINKPSYSSGQSSSTVSSGKISDLSNVKPKFDIDDMAKKMAGAKLDTKSTKRQVNDSVASQNERVSRNTKAKSEDLISGSQEPQTIITGPQEFVVYVTMDGRKTAKVITPYVDVELERLNKQRKRGG